MIVGECQCHITNIPISLYQDEASNSGQNHLLPFKKKNIHDQKYYYIAHLHIPVHNRTIVLRTASIKYI